MNWYNETIVANNLTGNNISITSGNDTTMISTNFFNIDGTKQDVDNTNNDNTNNNNNNNNNNNTNNINLNIGGELNISTATEQHISYYNKEEWGGDLSSIGRAMISGAITGAAVGYGMDAGKFLGNLASSSITNGVLSAGVNGAVLTSTLTYTSSVGSAMSQTAINGGNLGDILESGGKSMVSEDTLKNVVIGAVIGGVGGALGEWIKDVKADYMKKTGNNVSTGESTIFDQKSVNSGWSDSKLGVNSTYDINPITDKKILFKIDGSDYKNYLIDVLKQYRI